MVPILKTTLPSAARGAGAAYCPSNAITLGSFWLLVGILWLSLVMSLPAESLQTGIVEPNASLVSNSDASEEIWHYGKKGLIYGPEGPTNLWIGIRLQAWFDDDPGQDPSDADLRLERDSNPEPNRGRLRGGGLFGAKWLDVYFEYDKPSGYLLDLRATLKLGEQLFLRLGQW